MWYRLPHHLRGREETACSENYVGETERTIQTRLMEHRRPSCALSEVSRHIYQQSPEHTFSFDNVQILDREPDWFKRGVKEAIYIRTLKLSLNRD